MSNIIVLFEVTVKSGKMDDYLKMAGSLKESLANAEGLVRSERFTSLAAEGNYSVCLYGKMRNVFQDGEILPNTV